MNAYLRIARPDHWIKNIFVLPGTIFAGLLVPQKPGPELIGNVVLGLMATCLIASANYVLNEWLDARFDRFHPTKSLRPAVAGGMDPRIVTAEYLVLAFSGVAVSCLISRYFTLTEAVLLLMGVLYNVRPFRTKDIAFLDVISESFNNVLRLFLGWFIVTSAWIPPVSIILAYWMGGAFLMAVKRYAEFRMIRDPGRAALYRTSFGTYTEPSLLISAVFYALTSVCFSTIFLLKYRLELLLAIPFLCGLFCLYLHLSFKQDSTVQKPEKLYQERFLIVYSVGLVAIILALLYFHIPGLDNLLNRTLIKMP